MLLFWSCAALARVDPTISISDGFLSLGTTDVDGNESRLASSSDLILRPGAIWILDGDGDQLVFEGMLQGVSFITPSGLAPIPSLALFGVESHVVYLMGHTAFSFGVEAKQMPLFDAESSSVEVLKAFLLSVPASITYKLMYLKRQVLRVGAGGSLVLNSPKVTKGNSYNMQLSYEIRRAVKTEISLFYELSTLSTSVGKQADTALLLNFKFTFSGAKGMGVPNDEMD